MNNKDIYFIAVKAFITDTGGNLLITKIVLTAGIYLVDVFENKILTHRFMRCLNEK